jgi:hypothetical protein
MAARLTANVVLRGPDGVVVFLEAGSELPGWAEGHVGRHVLSDESGQPASAKPVEVDVTVHDADGTVREGTTEPVSSRPGPAGEAASSDAPPKAGPGSGRARWLDYTRAHGVTTPDDASRDDLVAACEAAGVPTE